MAAVLERSAFCGSSLARAPVAARGLPALSTSLTVRASKPVKKIQTKTPLGPCGDLTFKSGVDASGRGSKGKGVYQFKSKYGANVDGYSPIYSPEEWSPSGDVYTGGQTGLLLWAITLGAVLLAGAFLVYSTSALGS